MRRSSSGLILALLLAATGLGAWSHFSATPAAMEKAANDFLASLNDAQRTLASMPFDNPARLDWHFIPKETRKGLQVKEMSAEQRQAAFALLATGLSELGYAKAANVMDLESILRELEKVRVNGPLRDPERYYFTVFGTPGRAGEWGWSVEGHHLSLNFTVRNGELVSTTPAFFGANPAFVQSDVGAGPPAGTRVLADEERLAFDLLASFDARQLSKVLTADKAPNDLRGAAAPAPPSEPIQGLPAGDMQDAQQALLWSLIEVYADNMPADVREARLARVKQAGLDQVHFAWQGAKRPGFGHYYIIEGPSFVIELVNTQPDSAGNPANHIHSFWREKPGDFGLDRQ